MVVRCHRSWWSTSATATLNFDRMPPVSVFTTWRFSLSDPHPGIRRSNRSSATSIWPSGRRLQLPGDLPDVVLEPSERADPALVHHHAVAHDAGPRIARDVARHHIGAGHHADPGNPEQRPDLCPTELDLPLLGLQ